jgi:ankyrin repeat protein
MLEAAGARPESPSPIDDLLAACGRGDAVAAGKLGSADLIASLGDEDLQLLGDAAANERDDVVRACLAAGFPVNHEGEFGGTALHYACIHGRPDLVREILPYGPDLALRDRTHASSALGWAAYGADFVREPGADYAGCVRLLLEAGARPLSAEHVPADPELAALFGSRA